MSQSHDKPVWRYSPESQAWQTSHGGGEPLESTLRVASFNLWFDSYCWRERLDAVLEMLQAQRPHCIGLQEVRPQTLEAILACDWVRADYAVSGIAASSVDPYGTLILTRVTVQGFEMLPFPSAMGRCLLLARLEHKNRPLRFATVHLESLNSAPERGRQLEILSEHLGDIPSVVVGDFNLSAVGDENPQLEELGWLDLWPTLRPEEPGFSVDCERNTMYLYLSRDPKRVRYDRIVARPLSAWQPRSIELLGTRAIEQPDAEQDGFMDEISLFASDHFGLVGEWQLPAG